jgi:cell wall-associated NlpC family hydrolase
MFTASSAATALAGTTGGAVAMGPTTPTGATTGKTGGSVKGGGSAKSGGSVKSGGSANGPVVPKPSIHLSPITARSSRLVYKGPIYEKTAAGEIVPYQPVVAGQIVPVTGGSPVGVAAQTRPELLVPGSLARYVNGLAAAPMAAPLAVQNVIWAANQIIGLPYIFGGGHASFESPGYDCSGTVSFALHGASLLATPQDSSEFMSFGSHGAGRWIAIFSNPGHAYMDVAGLRLDTSAADDPSNQQGPRWRPLRPGNEGFTLRHPLGL